eukprot:GHVT01047744.1.p1 GENE.GHVT01047744.1~~GHVT01047744.1.p1  ORF type:complete len:109 (-),score=13.35 GHVT01047744.1:1109-1435(-)
MKVTVHCLNRVAWLPRLTTLSLMLIIAVLVVLAILIENFPALAGFLGAPRHHPHGADSRPSLWNRLRSLVRLGSSATGTAAREPQGWSAPREYSAQPAWSRSSYVRPV